MVTKKTVKKTTKTVAAKRPVAKKAVAKKTTAKARAPMQSFRVYKEAPAFTTFRISRQSVYWAILLTVVVISQLWLLKIQMDIADLTNIVLAQ